MPWEQNALQENATFMKEPRRGVTEIVFTRTYFLQEYIIKRATWI